MEKIIKFYMKIQIIMNSGGVRRTHAHVRARAG